MNLLSSLIPPPWDIVARVGVVLLVLGGAFTTGYFKGCEHVQNEINTQIIKDQTKVIRIDHTQTIIDNSIVTQLQKQITGLKTQNSNLQIQINKVPDTCVLSKEWVGLYNQSIIEPKVTP
jgi:hypothetical protein